MAWSPWHREDEPGPHPSGLGLAAFALLLVGAMICGGLGTLLSGWWLVSDQRARSTLVQDGIVPPDGFVEGWVDTRGDGRGTDGCAVVDNVLVRWVDRQRLAAVSLPGVQVYRDGPDLVVEAMGEALRCPIGRGPEAAAFEALVTHRSRTPRPLRRMAEPTDPRLRRHLGLDAIPDGP